MVIVRCTTSLPKSDGTAAWRNDVFFIYSRMHVQARIHLGKRDLLVLLFNSSHLFVGGAASSAGVMDGIWGLAFDGLASSGFKTRTFSVVNVVLVIADKCSVMPLTPFLWCCFVLVV